VKRPEKGVTGTKWGAAALALLLLVVDCSGTKKPDKLTQELLAKPKEALFEKGKALIEKKKYDQGRKYLTFVFETYPNDPLGRDALLLVADSFFKQGGSSGYTEARFRYRDYLNRYPGAPRRDYARYQFALTYDKEMERPDRDQTPTREAIDQYQALIREYPTSGFAGAARERVRVLTNILAEHEFSVGYFYMRKGASSAALARFTDLEQRYPEYGARDKLYFYAARVLEKLGRRQEADRYYARLTAEFPASEYARKVRAPRGEKPASAAAAARPSPKSKAQDPN
jgi:outer membrane protein assembly factor BamD